jgi:hypothetical protein
MNKPEYFPIENGLYTLTPGLKALGVDFGNQEFDKKVFHLTPDFPLFRKNKIDCRQERLSKYFCQKNLSTDKVQNLAKFILDQLIMEYPQVFSFNGKTLFCSHTNDQIGIDEHYNLEKFFNPSEVLNPPVSDLIDALALQIQEDIALVCKEQEKDFLGLLHLCSPSHWAAEDKIGMNFFDVHAPIPGIQKVNKIAGKLVETMIEKGPFVRFIWSFVTDERLNHHPEAPPGIDPIEWRGRSFNQDQKPPFYLRIERQVTWGFPVNESALFTIGVSFISGLDIKNNSERRSELVSALKSMTPESRDYKGVAHCFDKLILWLES